MIRWHKNPQDPDWIGSGPDFYKRGSFHNKVGMWLMWSYYVLIAFMVFRLIVVLNQ